MKALQQFVGAKVVSIGASDDESVWITFEMPDGSWDTQRNVSIYHAFHEPTAVRIDGKYVPPEEL
jgi:hypothetical protein